MNTMESTIATKNELLRKQLDEAINIVTTEFKGKFDKAGMPYTAHLFRVMNACDTLDEKIVAVLHDLFEDCPSWSAHQLMEAGFDSVIVMAVQSVTRNPGEHYDDFIDRAAKNPIGKVVKIRDLEDNMDIKRLHTITQKDVDRLIKYLRAYRRLKNEDVTPVIPATPLDGVKNAVIKFLRDKDDKPFVTNSQRSWTTHEFADEVENETKVGNDLIESMIVLTADRILRGKETLSNGE